MKHYKLPLLLAVATLLFFLYSNASLPVTDPVESNYALTAKEMVLCGNWLSPQIYGNFWYDKPIMIYWLLSLAYSIFGFTDFASRLPSALFSAISVYMIAQFMYAKYGKKRLAILTALLLTTSLEFWIISHSIITDAVLFTFTLGTMLYAYRGLTEGVRSYMVIAYAMAGLATLTKGPVGIVLPGLILLSFVICQRSVTYAKRLFPIAGILAFCIVTLPWYVAMYSIHGDDFVNAFLGLHNYLRATVSEHPKDNVWYYYLVLVPVSLLPWTGPALYELWQGRGHRNDYAFMSIWALGTVIFYSFMATKYPTYTFIANAPFLILGALGIERLYSTYRRRLWFILTIPTAFLWLLWFAASFFVSWGDWLPLYIFLPFALAFLAVAQWKRAYVAIPMVIVIGTVMISSYVITNGLVPFVNSRSAKEGTPLIADYPYDMFIYGDYQASLVFYSGREIKQLPDHPADKEKNSADMQSSVWRKGKDVMPRANEQALAKDIDRGRTVAVLVAKKNINAFRDTPLFSKMVTVDQTAAMYLFVNKRIPHDTYK